MKKIVGTTVLLLGLLAGALPASGSDRRGPEVTRLPGAIRIKLDPADRVNWTPERMARAKPLDLVLSGTASLGAPKPLDGADLRGDHRPILVPGTPAHGTPARMDGAPRQTAIERPFAAAAGQVPYERFQVPDPSSFDVSMHGKLYMLVDDDPYQEAVCSATVVPSATGMVAMTAGHCLMSPENGLAILDGAFVPGYLGNDQNPYGFWPLEYLYVTQEWAESTSNPSDSSKPDARYDVAAFSVMQYPYANGSLQEVVGARGIAFNIGQGQSFQSYGYPAADPFDGEKMISCNSDPALIDPDYPAPPFPNGMGCDMTGGSSGGGWVIEEQYLNSVVSYALKARPEMQFGPYFGNVALELFETASGLDYPDVDEPTVEEFATSVTFRLSQRAKARGRVSSPNAGCAASAPVVIAKITDGQGKAVAQTLAMADGTYRVKIKNRPGKYVAVVPESYRDSFTLCGASQSPPVKH